MISGTVPLESWEGCSAAELAGVWRLPRVELFASVGSTNDVARELASGGAPVGTLVIAERQTAGRGRVGRPWSSPQGLGLYLSFIARPAPHEIPSFPLRTGLAVAGSLDEWVDLPVRIKWPNDLILRGRKLGGILCEAIWEGGTLDQLVVGIGLNVLQNADDFPADVRGTAASLREEAGGVARYEVATRLVAAMRSLILPDGPSPGADWLAELRRRDFLLGSPVDLFEPESGRLVLSGRAAGIGPEGALRIETVDGMRTVTSGTVRLQIEERGR